MRTRTILFVLTFLTAFRDNDAVIAQEVDKTLLQTSENYVQCTKLIDTDPSKALAFAMTWVNNENPPSVAAKHCKALALFAADSFADAAAVLEDLSRSVPQSDPELWGNVNLQLGYAQRRAGDFSRASQTFSRGISSLSNMSGPSFDMMTVRLLVERGKTYLFSHNTGMALDDFTSAISLNGWDMRSLWMRAKTFVNLNAPQLAQANIQQMVRLDSSTIRAGQQRLRNELNSISSSAGR